MPRFADTGERTRLAASAGWPLQAFFARGGCGRRPDERPCRHLHGWTSHPRCRNAGNYRNCWELPEYWLELTAQSPHSQLPQAQRAEQPPEPMRRSLLLNVASFLVCVVTMQVAVGRSGRRRLFARARIRSRGPARGGSAELIQRTLGEVVPPAGVFFLYFLIWFF